MKQPLLFLLLFLLIGCNQNNSTKVEAKLTFPILSETSLVILGTIQDAGSPHIGCFKDCCAGLFASPDDNRKVISLGIVDPENKKSFLFEASPDISSQLKRLKEISRSKKELPDGIFLTHAHIGHYTGLMYLGKEAINSDQVPVYTMPKMKSFLEENGPWSQLVTNRNISLQGLLNKQAVTLTPNLQVTPFIVPHRDEFSETVGYIIEGPSKKALFIPDIDKWEKWETSIIEAISKVDYAFLDATFYSGTEINNRDISQIPHPFIIESMELFKDLPISEKQKIHFIHFNHTNPVIRSDSEMYQKVVEGGFNVAQINEVFGL